MACSETVSTAGRTAAPVFGAPNDGDIVLVGHPFAPIEMGELIRASCRAFRSVATSIRVYDVYGRGRTTNADLRREFDPLLTDRLSHSLNIFYLDGTEISDAFQRLPPLSPTSYNIIWSMWELTRYPGAWARDVGRFQEAWVTSRFTEASLRDAVSIPVSRMPVGIEPRLPWTHGRRYFGIPEAPFTFLFAFDFLSFIERKNPFAVLEAFRRLTRLRPRHDVRLVLQLNNSRERPLDHQRLLASLAEADDRIVLIDRVMTDAETKNIIRCCDCFVSLHRSEGFGGALAEAMYFRKTVIATGYSANLDFMSKENSLLVPYELVAVPAGSYPHADGQVWAEPDIDCAVDAMATLLDDQAHHRAVGEAASRQIRTRFSYGAVGSRYLSRIAEIMSVTRTSPSNAASFRHRTTETELGPSPGSPASPNMSTPMIVTRVPNDPALRPEDPRVPLLQGPVRRRFRGWCPICADRTVFHRQGDWLRDDLRCGRCDSIPRWRAVIHILELYFPEWRRLRIHESSPGGAASAKLQRECSDYCATHFFPGVPAGESYRGFRDENLEDQTFPDGHFDLVVTQDVFEHVLDPARGFKEVARTLRPGGAHVFTVPWYYWRPTTVRAVRTEAGVKYLKEPEYHGNPIDEAGSLVVTEWGWDFPDLVYRWTSMTTTPVRILDLRLGLAGEFIEVFISRKSGAL
jgi:glycosyltransferase involved in cell wall biosynthesis/SAM-dependent methyltransferase